VEDWLGRNRPGRYRLGKTGQVGTAGEVVLEAACQGLARNHIGSSGGRRSPSRAVKSPSRDLSGWLEYELNPGIEVQQEGDLLHVLNRVNADDPKAGGAMHGVSRAMVDNLVTGVTKGFQKGLEIVGTGWRAALSGRTLEISLGYAQPVRVPIPRA